MISMLVSFLVLNAVAGDSTGVGNGGGGWVCREADGQIRSVRLVDFFEAEAEHGLSIPLREGAPDALIQEARDRIAAINSVFAEKFDQKLQYVRERRVDIRGQRLRVVDDAQYRVVPDPAACLGGTVQYEQMVNFSETGEVLFNRDLWDRLSQLDQAGLWVHEAVYAVLREMENDRNSWRARRLVGLLFSDREPAVYASEFQFGAIPASAKVVDLSGGGRSFCAVTADGRVHCWGSNHSGILANQRLAMSAYPEEIPGIRGAVSVMVGLDFACAGLRDGRVMCWGSLPARGVRGRPILPVRVDSFQGARGMTVGHHNACVLQDEGAVVCSDSWIMGREEAYEMEELAGATHLVTDPLGARYCALQKEGGVACWGDTEETVGTDCEPADLGSVLEEACPVTAWKAGVVSLSLNLESTCAQFSDGRTECLGWVPASWLAAGASVCERDAGPYYGNPGSEGIYRYCAQPAVVRSSGMVSSQQGVGDAHCGLRLGGKVACWGASVKSLPGFLWWEATDSAPANPVLRKMVSGSNTLCGLTWHGQVQCVGEGSSGEMGNGQFFRSLEWMGVEFAGDFSGLAPSTP